MQAQRLARRRLFLRRRFGLIGRAGRGQMPATTNRQQTQHQAHERADQRQRFLETVKEGDKVWVKLMGFDERGKVRLSMKVVDQATGKELAKEEKTEE